MDLLLSKVDSEINRKTCAKVLIQDFEVSNQPNSTIDKCRTSLNHLLMLGYTAAILCYELDNPSKFLKSQKNVKKFKEALSSVTNPYNGVIMKVYLRCEFIYSNTGHMKSFLNVAFNQFDILSIRPTNDEFLKHVCLNSNCDIINLDFSADLNIFNAKDLLKQAAKRGIYFEVDYSDLLQSDLKRQNFVKKFSLLSKIMKKQNLLFSCGSDRKILYRSPYDVYGLTYMFDFPIESAKSVIDLNNTLEHSKRRILGNGLLTIEKVENATKNPSDENQALHQPPIKSAKIDQS